MPVCRMIAAVGTSAVACLGLLAPTIAHPVPHLPRQAITTVDTPAALPSPATDRQTPVFKSAVDLVTVAALVRDARGRLVRNLARTDFQVFESGRERSIVDFRASDHGPVSLAILFDVSGSMRGETQRAGQLAVEYILQRIEPAADEIALYSFDRELQQEVAFTNDPARIRAGLGRLTTFGQTSLYDAIDQTAAALGNRPSPRRAVVVITDGIDTSSTRSPSEVSGAASAIDVPVYVIAVVSPLDHRGTDAAVPSAASARAQSHLANLARWTGGTLSVVSVPAHASLAAHELMTELRHQYLLAFESTPEAGWHALDVKTKRHGLTVRARSGYSNQSRKIV